MPAEAAEQRLKQALGGGRLNGPDPAKNQSGQQNATGMTRRAAKGDNHHNLPAPEEQAGGAFE